MTLAIAILTVLLLGLNPVRLLVGGRRVSNKETRIRARHQGHRLTPFSLSSEYGTHYYLRCEQCKTELDLTDYRVAFVFWGSGLSLVAIIGIISWFIDK